MSLSPDQPLAAFFRLPEIYPRPRLSFLPCVIDNLDVGLLVNWRHRSSIGLEGQRATVKLLSKLSHTSISATKRDR